MILYNVTINVEDDIHDEWLAWMKKTHIPEVFSTKLFVEYKFLRVLNQSEDESGTTYCVQYFLKKLDHFLTYAEKHAPGLQAKTFEKYGNKIVAFRTLLEDI